MSSWKQSSGYFAGFRTFYLREPAPNRGRRMEPVHDSDAVIEADAGTGEAIARRDARPRFCPLTSAAVNGFADPMDVWKTHEVNIAECRKTADHVAPEPGCLCGFHAFKTLPELIKQEPLRRDMVYALVALGGNVIENQTGYKAEEALIVAVLNTVGRDQTEYPEDRVRRAGVPIIELSEIPAFASEWNLEFRPHTQPPPRIQYVDAESLEVYVAKRGFPRSDSDVPLTPASEVPDEYDRVDLPYMRNMEDIWFHERKPDPVIQIDPPFVTLKKWRVADRAGIVYAFWVPLDSGEDEPEFVYRHKQELMDLASVGKDHERQLHRERGRGSRLPDVPTIRRGR